MRTRRTVCLLVGALAGLAGVLLFLAIQSDSLLTLLAEPHPYEEYQPIRFPRWEGIYSLYGAFLVGWLMSCWLCRFFKRSDSPQTKGDRGSMWPLLAFFLLSLAVYLLHARNQPGLSPVAMGCIGSARNMAGGLGYTTFQVSLETRHIPQPESTWPPLYPALISVGIRAGQDAVLTARGLNLLCTALALFPTFWIGHALVGRKAAMFAAAAFPVFIPFAKVSAYAWSEGPFILWSLLACLALVALRKKNVPSTGATVVLSLAAGLASGLAIMTRYAGIFLIPAGCLYLLLHGWADSTWESGKKRKVLLELVCFNAGWMAAAVPFFLSLLIREGHVLVGSREASTLGFFFLLRWTWTTLLIDSIPVPFPLPTVLRNLYLTLMTGSIIVLSAWWAMRKRKGRGKTGGESTVPRWRSVLTETARSPLLALGLFPALYLILLLAVRSFVHLDGITYRFLCPIYPFLLLWGGWAVVRISGHVVLRAAPQWAFLFLIMLIFPHASFYRWMEDRIGIGQFAESERVQWVKTHTDLQDFIFSDMGEEVMLFAHRAVHAVEPFPYEQVLTPERIRGFRNRWQQRFQRFYVVISPEVPRLEARYSLLDYGQLIHDLSLGRTLGYSGFVPVADAPPGFKIYEIR